MSPAHPHICHSQHSDNMRGRPALNSPLKIGLLYLMRSPGYRTLYWDELSMLSSISFVTYLTVWQVELITPDRIYPKWLKLPHLESQGGQRGGRKLRQNRKKLGLSWWMMFVMGEAIFSQTWKLGKFDEKLGLFLIPIFVTESYPLRRSGGHLICSLALTTAFYSSRHQPVQHFNNLSKCQVLIKERKINQ